MRSIKQTSTTRSSRERGNCGTEFVFFIVQTGRDGVLRQAGVAAADPLEGIAMLVDDPVAEDVEFCCVEEAGAALLLDCCDVVCWPLLGMKLLSY